MEENFSMKLMLILGERRKHDREAALLWTHKFPNNPKSYTAFKRLEPRGRTTGN